eukprot:CAMPEP_0117067952 /NCGR_PEP_ID=MMETSP0472-20121206/47583_1 /TAXON_ID=693140 ORGANISM="Tiarina fusus, Strain LIS" /NCGR_SAMPLE_ID=MMETSP0472 /ASSEMBLY_ACC=CAM_ASM_000603 /LENGTH=79 /DNA_ID=CAMNT_0004789737 /DNA_START=28 /DNA_END=264 /DNA_ORIENTATION=+
MAQKIKRENSSISLLPKKKARLEPSPEPSDPTEFITKSFQANGFSPEEVQKTAQATLLKMTSSMVEEYTMEASKAARED